MRFDPCFWESALPAPDLEAFAVRPSRITLDADEAAFFEVTFVVWRCAKAEPAADFDALLAFLLRRVFDAFEAAAFDVFLL